MLFCQAISSSRAPGAVPRSVQRIRDFCLFCEIFVPSFIQRIRYLSRFMLSLLELAFFGFIACHANLNSSPIQAFVKIEHKRCRAIAIKSRTIIYQFAVSGFIAMTESRYSRQMLNVSQKGVVNKSVAHAIRPATVIEPAKALVRGCSETGPRFVQRLRGESVLWIFCVKRKVN